MYKIAVIGSGVIGLTTATELQKEFNKLCKITIYTENLSPYTTSDVAAGIWTPYFYQETNINDIVKWSRKTHDYFLKLWKDGRAEEAGLSLQVITIVSEDKDAGCPEWSSIPLGFERLSPIYIEKINRDCKKNYKSGFNYISFSAQTSKLLPFLQNQFVRNGGEIKMRKIHSFSDLSNYDLIINCSGLASGGLVKDDQLTPSRGQLVRVAAPWNFHTIVDMGDGGVVLVNQDRVILGGTNQMGDTSLAVSEEDTQMILKKCYQLVPALEKSPIVDISVGLRPVRTRVRLEIETIQSNDRTLQIIHNYGHGGCGITLSFGCAVDVVHLVRQVVRCKHKL